jgi:anaerobic magnesium-protoporphyrin IX monomethyl ester cyclase
VRTLLINIGRPTEVRIPQGLLYLASAIHNAGYEVIIHDEALTKSPEVSYRQILSHDADIIGLSVYSVPWQLKRAEYLSKAIKASRKKTLIIWGGWHATLYPRHCILNKDIDIVVQGPGEKPTVEVLRAIVQKRTLRGISGLVYREDGLIVETGPSGMDPEFLFPPLNFELIDFETYLKKHDRGRGILQYITTRGCNAQCRFCIMAHLFKNRLFRKPIDQVHSELQYLLKRHKISTIHFSDDNTFRNDREAVQLCNTISRLSNHREIPWRCATRIKTLSNLSGDTYKKLTERGCEGVVVGIESGVDRVLNLMQKGIDVSVTQKALKHLAANGLDKNLFSFLFNFTGETQKEAMETLKLVRKTRLMFPKSIIMLHVYFPGASESKTVPLEVAKNLPFSKIFEQHYQEHIRNYRVGRTPINILRFFLNASEERIQQRMSFLRTLRYKTIHFRIKNGIFKFPFEYYLSVVIVKRIKKLLVRINSHQN